MTHTATTIADAVATRSAFLVTRRRLLRNAGGVAFGVALTTAMPQKASACQGPYGNTQCGPNPYCSSNRCYDSGACHNSTTTQPRGYASADCIASGSGYINCWCVCSAGHNIYRCCDCCVDYPAGGTCNSGSCGGGSWWKCSCLGTICGTQNCC
jgi:hypothetical protein